MKSLGKQLRNERDAKGDTLREVSSSIGIDQSLISKIEKNERKPTREQIIKLAEYYGLSIRGLLNDWHAEIIVEKLVGCSQPNEVLELAKQKIENLEIERNEE